MKKKLIALILIFTMTISLISSIPVDAKVKLSSKTKSITVGNSVTVKIKGTRQKVIWSVSNSRIMITQKTKTSAKIKAIRKGTSYLKARVGKKTYKCKVTVKEREKKSYDKKSPSADLIGYKLLNTRDGVIAILTNNNECSVKLNATMVYYKSGTPLDASSETNYAFEKGNTCAFLFPSPRNYDFSPVAYDNYEINISVEVANNLVCGAKKINVISNMGYNNVVATLTNNSGENLEFITIAIVFYDAIGNAVGYDYKYADCKMAGNTNYLTFDFPYDENYQMIIPSSYEIFVNDAYTYTWMS